MQNYRREPNYQQSRPFFRQPFHEAYYNKRVFDNNNNGDRSNQRWIHGSLINKEQQKHSLKQKFANPPSCPIQLQNHRRVGQMDMESSNRVFRMGDSTAQTVKPSIKVLIDVNSISLEDRIVEDEKKPRGSVSDEVYLLQAFETIKNVPNYALSKHAKGSNHCEDEKINPKLGALVSKTPVVPLLMKTVVNSTEEVSAQTSALQNSCAKGGFGSFRRGKPTPNVHPADSSKLFTIDEKAGGCFVYENDFSSSHVKNKAGFNCSSANNNIRVPYHNPRGFSNQRHY